MIVILDRRRWSPILEILTPFIVILPSTASIIRKSANVREDLPAPVRPTIPIYDKKIAMIYA